MKKLNIAVLFLFAFILVGATAGAAEVKIGYANLQRALNECKAGIKAKADLKEEAQKLEKELQTQQEGLKKLKEEIDKKAKVWNKETRERKEQDFKVKSQEFQKQFVDYGEELNKKKQATEARIIGELRDVVEEIAKKKKYSYVFERSVGGLLYAPEDADLTDEVIEIYDKKFKAKGK
ncbi:MAG: OmpH family outer membrane protein [Thermodesulfobacteriota bacterium]